MFISFTQLSVATQEAIFTNLVHVIDIRPHGVERDLVVRILLHHGLHLVDVMIAVATLVPAQRPVRRHVRGADHLMKLPDDLLGTRTGEHKPVNKNENGKCPYTSRDIHPRAVNSRVSKTSWLSKRTDR